MVLQIAGVVLGVIFLLGLFVLVALLVAFR